MKQLLLRTTLAAGIVGLCVTLFAPNYMEQELQVIFRAHVRKDGIKTPISRDKIKDFVRDRENGLLLFFSNSRCEFRAANDFPKWRRCVLKDRFITAARINELTQANPLLLDDLHTGLLPHPVEKIFNEFARTVSRSRRKAGAAVMNLKVRLGLDLQGGMRAVFRADYDTYSSRLQEKYAAKLKQLEGDVKAPGKKGKEAQQELERVKGLLEMNEARKLELLKEARSVIVKRLVALNLSEPEVRVQEASYSIGVDMPGVTNSSEVLRKIKTVVTVEYRLVHDKLTDDVNNTYRKEISLITSLYRKNRARENEIREMLDDIARKAGITPDRGRLFLSWRRGKRSDSPTLPRDFMVLGPPRLDGGDMTGANISVDPESGYYMIHFELNADGADRFGKLTAASIKRRMAILWGERVVSAPVIQGAIMGGNGQITGDFNEKEAGEVAAVIREGALPLPLELLSVSFIGPSLGQDSIVAGLISIALGFLLVMIFMVGYYKLSGIVANVALFLNLLIIAAILSLMEFTLTLPGFAGIILTVGMAVDANVLIFEKIKEEIRSGKGPSIAVESGFKSSFWTILDANVTTLIAAVILWKVGEGAGDSAIQGFAVTLFFGLVSSMFTALFVSRLVFDWTLRLFKPKRLSIGYGLHKEASA